MLTEAALVSCSTLRTVRRAYTAQTKLLSSVLSLQGCEMGERHAALTCTHLSRAPCSCRASLEMCILMKIVQELPVSAACGQGRAWH